MESWEQCWEEYWEECWELDIIHQNRWNFHSIVFLAEFHWYRYITLWQFDSAGENSHAIKWKTHWLDRAIFNSHVKLPEGKWFLLWNMFLLFNLLREEWSQLTNSYCSSWNHQPHIASGSLIKFSVWLWFKIIRFMGLIQNRWKPNHSGLGLIQLQ